MAEIIPLMEELIIMVKEMVMITIMEVVAIVMKMVNTFEKASSCTFFSISAKLQFFRY